MAMAPREAYMWCMANWFLECVYCNAKFERSPIVEDNLTILTFPLKPKFPADGAERECPQCGRKAMYHRVQFRYEE